MQRVRAEHRNRELPGLGRTIRLQQLRRSSQPLNLILIPIFRERGGRRRRFDRVFTREGSQQPPSSLTPDPHMFSVRQITSSTVHRCSVGKTAPGWARGSRVVKKKRNGAVVHTNPLVTSTFHGAFDPLEVMSHTDSVQALSAHASAVQTTNSFMTQPHDGTRTLQINNWRECTQSRWVLKTIQFGYRLQFATSPPHFKGIIYSHVREELKHVLQDEIYSLLNKRAIRVVPPEKSHSGFYSRYFLVPKKGTRALRPILDLRALNKYLRKYKFRMLTHSTLLKLVRLGNWFTSIDLKDAYFHIKIYPPHRKFLRFAFLGVTYEYLVLPFGMSLSPRVFIKCTEIARPIVCQCILTPLREKGIRLATYIDDWLVTAQSEQEVRYHTTMLLEHIQKLGLKLNTEKSVLIPAQSITYLGLSLDSVTFRARLSRDRVVKFTRCLNEFQRGKNVSFRTCLRLLGLMASALIVIPLGRLFMREFQRWVASLRLDPLRHCRRRVRVTSEAVFALRQWRHPTFLVQGVPMGVVQARKVITTDASLYGWGGMYEGRIVNGRWGHHLINLHINYLEMLAVFLTMKHFLPFLKGHHVLVRTDNTTVVAYINRQGGLRSLPLHMLARKLILWSNANLSSLRATHVQGVMNRGADLLSRGNSLYGEWKLNKEVVEQIWEIYGKATVDLFASHDNAQCPLFFYLKDQSAPLGIDALAHDWPRTLLYAFPPIALISPTLYRVREEGLKLILIAPRWPGKYWLAEIIHMLYEDPWSLPLRRDLLSQAGGEIFHPHPERLALWAWPVSG
ncbi:uncharacterized protein LOC130092365 [Rhinichthys klamathensis goyatoka]|uniref:uncharacterized protein LOC130092365 n=1 Tax=Rhinichthys klamathensis goyatoka TaxID=3034132 RepID=UPI0024B4D969|nr:uncharacterized protein LOC130092365 [Rhinichthys klamathensis goyatoka]